MNCLKITWVWFALLAGCSGFACDQQETFGGGILLKGSEMRAACGAIARLHFDLAHAKAGFQLNTSEVLFRGVSQDGLD